MATSRVHYRRAPILEAIIDVQAGSLNGVAVERLGEIDWHSDGHVGDRQPLYRSDVSIQGEAAGPNVSAAHTQIGFRYVDLVRQQIVQARTDGFSLSKLAPYDHWEPFRNEARKLWRVYCAAVTPDLTSRISVRYINRLELPLPIDDLKDYLRTAPEISPDLPQGLRSFVVQLQIPRQDVPGLIIINEGLLPPTVPETAAMLLDIDVLRPIVTSANNDALWDMFEDLRVCKNAVFEACITDKTRSLIS